jgi:hypothetical protein
MDNERLAARKHELRPLWRRSRLSGAVHSLKTDKLVYPGNQGLGKAIAIALSVMSFGGDIGDSCHVGQASFSIAQIASLPTMHG